MSNALFQPNPIIQNIINKSSPIIKACEKKYNLPPRYLAFDLSLHLFRFSKVELYPEQNVLNLDLIESECDRCAKSLYQRINNIPKKFKKMLTYNEKKSKIFISNLDPFEKFNNHKLKPIIFKEVDPNIGSLIQKQIHYLGCQRYDTLIHLGLFWVKQIIPFAYASFSRLDRKYHLNSLPFKDNMDHVLFLSRIFSINSAPKNSISYLLSECCKYIQNYPLTQNISTIITSLNPNVLFNGAAFKSSNFIPYATFPFEPLYYKNRYTTRKKYIELFGKKYSNKKSDLSNVTTKKFPSKPVVLMGYGLNKTTSKALKTNFKIKRVSLQEYRKG